MEHYFIIWNAPVIAADSLGRCRRPVLNNSSHRSIDARRVSGVTAVHRAINILNELSQTDHGLRLTDISIRTQLAKPTVHRLLQTLMHRALVEFEPETQHYQLGPRILEYGLRRLQRLELRQVALPFMRQLRDETLETVTLSVVMGNERQYVEQLESPREVRQTIELGRRVPLHAGGSGKAILAFFTEDRLEQYLSEVTLHSFTPHTINDPAVLRAELERVRQRGFSYSIQERQTGAATVAAPIMNGKGEVEGCLSVSGPYQRFTPDKIEDYGALVRNAARNISRQLGWRTEV